jgi:hypothetical protein
MAGAAFLLEAPRSAAASQLNACRDALRHS